MFAQKKKNKNYIILYIMYFWLMVLWCLESLKNLSFLLTSGYPKKRKKKNSSFLLMQTEKH